MFKTKYVDYVDIGVKEGFKIYQGFSSAIFGLFLLFTAVFWLVVYGDFDNNSMAYNGIEVYAVITENPDYVDISRDDESARYVWMCNYKYISVDGVTYSGRYDYHASKEEAKEHTGDRVQITINPKDGTSTTQPLKYFVEKVDNIYTDLTVACALSGGLLISSYFFFYRVVYRRAADKKILKKFKCSYFNDGLTEGEVVTVIGLIWYYVKVRYYDENGIAHEKWAREWFSPKKAKFLKDKSHIKIVLYKNTYGILEEMPLKSMVK